MSLNPFANSLLPANGDVSKYIDKKVWKGLDLWCKGHPIPNSLISGPKGVGKSTLIQHYFTAERRQALAREQKDLVQLCYFYGGELKTDAMVFLSLIDAVSGSLGDLDPDCEDRRALEAELQGLREDPRYADVRTDERAGLLLLEASAKKLRERGYCVTLVIDEFQHLTCSANCAAETFSAMASLAQKGLISYIVVTDCHIGVGSQNYAISSFDRIFRDPLILSGVTDKKAVAALQAGIQAKLEEWQEGEEAPITISSDELAALWTMTGGIPELLQEGLKALYEYREESRDPLDWAGLQALALDGGRDLMSRWTKHLDEGSWHTLRSVITEVNDERVVRELPKEDDRRSELKGCGLIEKNSRTKDWSLVCPLFEEYLRQELGRPKKETDDLERYFKLVEKFGGSGVSLNLQLVNGDLVQSGGIKGEVVSVSNGIGISELLRLLGGTASGHAALADHRGMFAQALSQRLQQALPAGSFQLPARPDGMDPAEYDQLCDQQFHQIERQIVQDVEVDQDEDLANVSEAELRTLDQRFQEARSRCRSGLTDRLLEAQSARCQFYLKLSVVVEDALDLPGVQMEDYSPQLILYGKALEQVLRDKLFELFHRDETLGTYDLKINRRVPGSRNTFQMMRPEETNIGNYPHLISRHTAYLSQLCGKGLDRPYTASWWDRLQRDIHGARAIRNSAGHAGSSSPMRAHLDQMCRYLIGDEAEEGIFARLAVGPRLVDALFPKPARQLSMEEIGRLKGREQAVSITKIKPNGGLNAVTRQDGLPVKISRSSVEQYRAAHPGLTLAAGATLLVRLDYDEQVCSRDYFSATILGEAGCPV